MKKFNNIFIGILILIIVALLFAFGYWFHGKVNPPPEASVDTILLIDTMEHYIDVHHYHSRLDTIIFHDTLYRDVDTAAILKSFYAKHFYTRHWEDSLMSITIKDVVSQNKFLDSTLSYKILRPQTIIENTNIEYNYTKYLYFGLTATYPELKNADLSLFYAFPGGYAGIGYHPFIKSVSLKWGVPIKKFK